MGGRLCAVLVAVRRGCWCWERVGLPYRVDKLRTRHAILHREFSNQMLTTPRDGPRGFLLQRLRARGPVGRA
eukprot:COSAG02_NODE_350_length_24063_cov_47.131447_18_plen_72_part_00